MKTTDQLKLQMIHELVNHGEVIKGYLDLTILAIIAYDHSSILHLRLGDHLYDLKFKDGYEAREMLHNDKELEQLSLSLRVATS